MLFYAKKNPLEFFLKGFIDDFFRFLTISTVPMYL